MIDPVFRAEVENAKLEFKPGERVRFCEYLKSLRGEVEIICRRRKKHLSDPLRRYYFGVVIAIPAEECGMTKQEMHDAMKWLFLRVEKNGVKTVRSISRASGFANDEMDEYIDKVKRFWAERGCRIPDPNEVDMPEYVETHNEN